MNKSDYLAILNTNCFLHEKKTFDKELLSFKAPVSDLLKDCLNRWINECSKSEATTETYLFAINSILSLTFENAKEIDLVDVLLIDDSDIRIYLDKVRKIGHSPRTIKSRICILSSLIRWLLDNRLLARNPIKRTTIKSLKVEKTGVKKGTGFRHSLSLDEAQKIKDWATNKETPIKKGLSVLLQMVGGLRSAEVSTLKGKNILLEMRKGKKFYFMIIVGKGGKTRKVPIENSIIKLLLKTMKDQNIDLKSSKFILTNNEKPLSPRQVQRYAKEAAEIVDRKDEISSHDLRRTAATLKKINGASIEELQYYLGHSNPTTTIDCYVTTIPELKTTTGLE